MASLESELERARELSVDELADAIEAIGFECTRCGACCRGTTEDPHTATIFPDEIRTLTDDEYDWRDVARPMPFGLDEAGGGDTFEWALQTDDCGDCHFYADGDDGRRGTCTVYAQRPFICQTYPFSLRTQPEGNGDTADGPTQPMGDVVDERGHVRAHECEGVGRDIDREEAERLAETLKDRTVRELQEAIAVRESYRPVETDGIVVYDSEGAKRPSGAPVRR